MGMRGRLESKIVMEFKIKRENSKMMIKDSLLGTFSKTYNTSICFR